MSPRSEHRSPRLQHRSPRLQHRSPRSLHRSPRNLPQSPRNLARFALHRTQAQVDLSTFQRSVELTRLSRTLPPFQQPHFNLEVRRSRQARSRLRRATLRLVRHHAEAPQKTLQLRTWSLANWVEHQRPMPVRLRTAGSTHWCSAVARESAPRSRAETPATTRAPPRSAPRAPPAPGSAARAASCPGIGHSIR
jgi:hypothetical protein